MLKKIVMYRRASALLQGGGRVGKKFEIVK